MYKNLRDLFKNKYAINDENKPYGVINDRSLIITQRAPQAKPCREKDSKKTSYQTYLELKHKLYHKSICTSRAPSVGKSPLSRGQESLNVSPRAKQPNVQSYLVPHNQEHTIFTKGSQFNSLNNLSSHLLSMHSRKQSLYIKPLEDNNKIYDARTDRVERSTKYVSIIPDSKVKQVFLNVNHQDDINNQLQVQKAFQPGNSISRNPSEDKNVGDFRPKINININNLYNFQNQIQSKRGFIVDVNSKSPNNQSKDQTITVTPKNKNQKVRENHSYKKKTPIAEKPPTQYAKIKHQIFQAASGSLLAESIQVGKENNNKTGAMIQTFLKNYQIPLRQQSQSEVPLLLTKRKDIDDSFTEQAISKNNFVFHYVIGKGGFGKVWKVENKKTRKFFAMKEMAKSKIIAKRSVSSVMNERNLLTQLKHDFIVNMSFSFQDRESLYLIMDLMTGGDLRFHIGKMRRMKEHQTKFFIACIVLALEYLHNNNIIHRDLKPENLVLDNLGYAYLTDLGIARTLRPDNSSDTSGTPGYMAPEVMCRQNHGIAADYFALGVIAYEFMMGRRPYHGRSRNEIRDQILAKQVQIKRSEVPDDYSWEAADFVNGLLQRKAINRLGFNGPDEVKLHPWLKEFQWEPLKRKELTPPYVPICIDTNDEYKNQISQDEQESNEDLIAQNQLVLRRESVQNLFAGYDKQCLLTHFD